MDPLWLLLGASRWPVLIGTGKILVDDVDESMLLIFNPVLNAASSASAIPEPATALLALAAFVPLALVRRGRSRG